MARASKIRGGQTWETRFQYDRLAENADETEWQAVLHGQAHVSAGTADEAMADAGDENAPASAEELIDRDRLQGQELLQESRQGTVYELLLERNTHLGEAYPFEIDGNSLIYRPAGLPIYELMLGICQAPSLTAEPYCQLPRLFELLSMHAGRGYLGPRAVGYRTGWPRPADLTGFKSVIDDLKIRSGNYPSEWQWQPAEYLPNDPAPKFVKEEGLDVVVWDTWSDRRTGQLYLLGQCACGKDWLKKDKDLDLEDFTEWFRLPRVKPVRGFFTPRYAVTSILYTLSHSAGLVFDRIRMVQALNEPHVAEDLEQLQTQIFACLDIAKQPITDLIEAAGEEVTA